MGNHRLYVACYTLSNDASEDFQNFHYNQNDAFFITEVKIGFTRTF